MKVLLVLSTVLAGAAGLGYSTSGDMEPGQSRKMTESSWVVCSKPSSRIAWDFVSLFDNLDFNVDHNMVSRDLVVYGASGDDAHELVRRWWLYFMAGNQVATLARNTPEDLVSNHWRSRQRVACEGKQRCWLQFSPYARACIAVESGGAGAVVRPTRETSPRRVVYLVFGLLIGGLAHWLSKSKFFHLIAAVFAFEVAGFLILVLLITRTVTKGRLGLLVGAGASLGYAGAALHLLRMRAVLVLADYWEYAVGYQALMFAFAVSFVAWERRRPVFKHGTRVVCKWCLRGLGAFLCNVAISSESIKAFFWFVAFVWWAKNRVQKLFGWRQYHDDKKKQGKSKAQ